MAESVVSLTYGAALYEAAKDVGKVEQILDEVKQLSSLIEGNEEISDFLNSPAIAPKEKKDVVEKTLKGIFCDEIINFVFVLIDKGRTGEVKRIARHYRRLYDQDAGVAEGVIYSVVPLKDEQLHRFEGEMSRLLQKKVKLKNRIDKKLIGGIKIQVDGKMIDQSYQHDLYRLLKELES